MKPLAVPLAALALTAALASGSSAQTAPPAAATPVPWQPRPVIIIDPRPYLATPRPTPHVVVNRNAPHRRATAPPRRAPSAARTPETFEHIDTSRPPARPVLL